MREETKARAKGAGISGSGRRKFGSVITALLVAAAWMPRDATLAKPAIREKPARIAQPLTVAKADAGAGAAKIVAEEPIHDFGEMWIGPALEHTFVIENKGQSPLKISSVRPSCGCTVAGKYPSTIAPGEKGSFPFKIASKKLRGKYEKSIKVYSNDPDMPELQLKLRGVCKRYIDVVPTNAYFGKITNDEPRENILKITNNTDKPLEVSLSKAEDGKFKFELVETEKGKEYELHIKLDPPFAPGSLRGTTNLLTNVEAQKEIRIGATARIPERLEVQPPSIVISPARVKDRGYSRPIRFTNYGTNPVKVLAATADDENISVTVKERTEGKAYTINVEMPAGWTPPEGGRTITLTTDDPDKPTIEIKVKTVASRRSPKKAIASKAKRPAEQMVGKIAPGMSVKTVEGKSLTASDLAGKVTVLDFFAVNCGFCKKQIPRLEKVRQDYESKGVRFVAVSQTMRKKYSDTDVKNKVAELGFKGELVIDHDNTAGPLYKATSFPTMVVVGKDGKVAAVNIGNIGDLESKLKSQLDALLAGKPIPQVAVSTMPKLTDAPSKAKTPRKRPAEQMVGQAAPKFELTTVAGKKLSNETLAGTVTVLDFFAVNCGYCGKQIPRMEKVRKEYEGKGVRFVAVSQTMRGKKFSDDDIKNKIKTLKFNGELAIDSANTVGPKFKASGFPTMVILDKKGKIGAVNIGNVGDLESRMKTQLDAMLAGKPVPQIAAAKPKPRPTPAAKGNVVGKPAPKFDTKTVEGKPVSNESLKGTVTVLDFIAVNCGYCKKQIPRVEKIRQEYESKGVRFIAVSETMGRKTFSDDEVKAKLTSFNFKGELVIDTGNKIGPKFGATGFPTMIILGKDGKVAAANIGNLGDLEVRMKAQLDALLEDKPVPAKYVGTTARKKRSRPAEALVGKPAPQFVAMKTLAGKEISNSDFANHPATVLNFVAPNCGFCKRSLPDVEKVRKEYESKGVRFINVAQTMRKKYTTDEVVEVFKKTGSQLEIAHDPDNIIGKLFKAVSFPTMIVVSRSGKIEAVNIGAKKNLDTLLKGQLDKLLAVKGG